jgi:hypothetical protein
MIIPPELRIITIKQPWASLIVAGIKDVENRSWPFPSTLTLPFTIAVHAGAKLDPKSTADELPTRAVVGLVDVVDCRIGLHTAGRYDGCDSPWAIPGQHHWVLANPVKFADPVPATGRMGLMPVSPELYAAICAAANP